MSQVTTTTALHTGQIADCLMAFEETVTSPLPGLGHGRLADLVAVATYVLTTIHIF